MEALFAVLAIGAGIVGWWGCATWLRRKDLGPVLRHLAGMVAGFLAMFLFTGIAIATGLAPSRAGEASTPRGGIEYATAIQDAAALPPDEPAARSQTEQHTAEGSSAAARPPEVDRLAGLYQELMRFKSEPDFKKVGFSVCCKYNSWLQRAEKLRDQGSNEMWLQLGVLPGEVLMLGMEYLHSKGAETKFTRNEVPRLEAALFPGTSKAPSPTVLEHSERVTASQDTPAAKPDAEGAACREDLQCWGDKNSIGASIQCKKPIERLAEYAHEWTDGILEVKMSHFRWKTQRGGVVTFIGDKLRFQNGFGAWQNVVYECDYDGKNVLDVRVHPGRL